MAEPAKAIPQRIIPGVLVPLAPGAKKADAGFIKMTNEALALSYGYSGVISEDRFLTIDELKGDL
jgi:hypothetical protein